METVKTCGRTGQKKEKVFHIFITFIYRFIYHVYQSLLVDKVDCLLKIQQITTLTII